MQIWNFNILYLHVLKKSDSYISLQSCPQKFSTDSVIMPQLISGDKMK